MKMSSRSNLFRLSLWITAAFLGGWVTAAAQTGPGASGTGRGNAVDLGFDQDANLSPAEQAAWADEKSQTILQTRDYVARLLAQARQADRPDIVKINCLNNKLMEVEAQIAAFEDRRTALRESISLGDDERRMHEYRVLVVVYQKIQSLRGEAEACIGEEMGYMGEPVVTVTPPEGQDLTGDLTNPEVPSVYVDRPPHGSGYY